MARLEDAAAAYDKYCGSVKEHKFYGKWIRGVERVERRAPLRKLAYAAVGREFHDYGLLVRLDPATPTLMARCFEKHLNKVAGVDVRYQRNGAS